MAICLLRNMVVYFLLLLTPVLDLCRDVGFTLFFFSSAASIALGLSLLSWLVLLSWFSFPDDDNIILYHVPELRKMTVIRTYISKMPPRTAHLTFEFCWSIHTEEAKEHEDEHYECKKRRKWWINRLKHTHQIKQHRKSPIQRRGTKRK